MWRSWRVKNCYLVNAVICPCIWINCSMCKQCLVVHFVFKESHHLCILFPIWIGRFFPFLRWGGSVCMCMQVPRSVGICASFKINTLDARALLFCVSSAWRIFKSCLCHNFRILMSYCPCIALSMISAQMASVITNKRMFFCTCTHIFLVAK